MSLFGGPLSTKEALDLGAAFGFAEEALKEEEEAEKGLEPNEKEESSGIDPSKIDDTNLRLIRNGNPELFEYIVELAYKQAKKWRKERLEMEAIREEVAEELKALEDTERMLRENE
jgi:hypothetical protein